MRILLTNDDGITAEGLRGLEEALGRLGHLVWVVAPDHNWSGGAQAITVGGTIEAERVSRVSGHLAYRVYGSPADCVRVAHALLPSRPDLVVSGVNNGWNLGPDTYRSGTVGAAREAVLNGIPGLAISAMEGWPFADMLAQHLSALVSLAVQHRTHVVNVNLPQCPGTERRMVEPAWGGLREEAYVDENPGVGRIRVRLTRRVVTALDGITTDLETVMAGQVAISVLPVGPSPLLERPAMEVGASAAVV